MKWFDFLSTKPWSVRKAQIGGDPRMFGQGEDPTMFGTPNVAFSDGDQPITMSIPGVEGSINLDVSLKAVKEAMEKQLGSGFFYPITNIVARPMAGKFGEARSKQPHTIYVNEEAIVGAVKQAVEVEARKAEQSGVKARFTPEIGKRIEDKIANLIATTLAHEKRHDEDFQQKWHEILTTGRGSFTSVPESHGEQAGQAAGAKFRWYRP